MSEHPAGTLYHTLAWLGVARDAFGCRGFYMEARSADGSLSGVMPLVQQSSRVFGARLTSLPFCNYGGPLELGAGVAEALMAKAKELAAQLGISNVELRDSAQRDCDWATRTDKVTFELLLPPTSELLGKALGSKLRSQIRRAEREPIRVRRGQQELLSDFYRVFAENMRDVGTPVYPRRFFDVIGRRLEHNFSIVVIDLDGVPAAAGLLLFHRNAAEIPWAACTHAGKSRSLNMRLYWELLLASQDRGVSLFDFGRCSVDSGTFRFKAQWGARMRPLYWYRLPVPLSSAPTSEGRLMAIATRAWQHLPLRMANRIGPMISPGLPW